MKTWYPHGTSADGLRRASRSERLCAIHTAKPSHSARRDGHSCGVSGFAATSQHTKTTFSNKNELGPALDLSLVASLHPRKDS